MIEAQPLRLPPVAVAKNVKPKRQRKKPAAKPAAPERRCRWRLRRLPYGGGDGDRVR